MPSINAAAAAESTFPGLCFAIRSTVAAPPSAMSPPMLDNRSVRLGDRRPNMATPLGRVYLSEGLPAPGEPRKEALAAVAAAPHVVASVGIGIGIVVVA